MNFLFNTTFYKILKQLIVDRAKNLGQKNYSLQIFQGSYLTNVQPKLRVAGAHICNIHLPSDDDHRNSLHVLSFDE